MGIYESVQQDMKAALKASDTVRLSVLRMVVSAIKTQAIDKKVDNLPDSDVIQILKKQVKQRRESIDQFSKGNRQDLADREAKELAILEKYVPEQMDEAAVERLVLDAIKESGMATKADMGKLMKMVMEKAGGRCDGRLLSQAVMKHLK
jgi:uncharacterized protein YqeY